MKTDDNLRHIYRFNAWEIAEYRRQILVAGREDVWKRVWSRVGGLLNLYEIDAVQRAVRLLGS